MATRCHVRRTDTDGAKKKRKKLPLILAGIVLFLVVWQVLFFVMPLMPSPWPPFYWAWPVHGQVVDGDTGAPLEGVIIAAHWELEGPWGGLAKQLAVMEAVTDREGRFTFRWWRPRLRWPLWELLRSDAPTLLFFKSGYHTGGCNNDVFAHYGLATLGPFPSSDCEGAVTKLKKFQGSEQEYAENLRDLDHDLEFAFNENDCSWKKIPHMLVAMDRERKRLEAKGVHTKLGGNPSSLDDRAGFANEHRVWFAQAIPAELYAMTRSLLVGLCVACGLACIRIASAYEVPTHQDISQKALEASVLAAPSSVLSSLQLKAIDDDPKIFPTPTEIQGPFST